jgi:hypothetical protein
MCRKQHRKKTVSIALFSSILVLWLAFPGSAAHRKPESETALKQADTFKTESSAFSLALSKQISGNSFSVFKITNNNRYAQNEIALSQLKREKIPPPIRKGMPKKSGRLENSLFTASLLTLTTLNIADYVSTVRALHLPGLEEGNPVMRPFTKNMLVFSVVKLGISALDFYLLERLHKKNRALGWIFSIAGNIAMSYIVSNNIHKIRSVAGE